MFPAPTPPRRLRPLAGTRPLSYRTRRIRLLEPSVGAGDPALPTQAHELDVLRRHVVAACRALMKPGARQRGLGDLGDELHEWFAEHARELGGRVPFGEDADRAQVRAGLKRFVDSVEGKLARREPKPKPSAVQFRLDWIGETLSLSPFERDVLNVAVRNVLYEPLHAFVCHVSNNHPDIDEIDVGTMALLTGHPAKGVGGALASSQPLRQLGLLESRGGGDFAPSGTVMRLMRTRTTDAERLRDTLFGTAKPSQLTWEDFDHLHARELNHDLLAAALDAREKGVNVLFHGPPGTGKTEFAKVLGARLKARTVFVGEADEEGGEPNRHDRIAHLALASTLAARAGRTVLVVDEADDIFTGVDEDRRSSRIGSKVFTNRIVEGSAAPTIWITNQPDRLGPATMRRMSLAVRFDAPDTRRRRRMAERMAERHEVKLEGKALDRLAAIETAPALLDAGFRAARLTGGEAPVVEQAARSLARAMGEEAPVRALPGPVPFDPALSSADTDLVALAEKVAAAPSRALSFLMSGPPGTGKSAYARFLAEKMGLEVLVRRASDLKSMWVGGTEANIAAAFADAREREAMLIVDEADSMLASRKGAERSWEVSEVNEMLTWMEAHPLPFAMTTNALDALDAAAMRRFVFKVAFGFMDEGQIATSFERAFDMAAPPFVLDLANLTPGDIAVVARKAELLGERDPEVLGRWLVAECEAKPDGRRGRLGFTPAARAAPRTALREPKGE